MMKKCLLLVNFGGPRNLNEVEEFLKELLFDQDVIQTGLPKLLHRFIFSRVAKKRAPNTSEDYEQIGGASPIYKDTEALASILREKLNIDIITFHRYLPKTHKETIDKIKNGAFDDILVFPLFPQFTYATTGSVARFFSKYLPKKHLQKFRWIKSYASNPFFINAYANCIEDFLNENNLKKEETLLLFSAHGVPKKYIDKGDPYEKECLDSFRLVMKKLNSLQGMLIFQSKFGKGEWLRPYTIDVSNEIKNYLGNNKAVAIVPISFTSDHIETLFEVEEQYIHPIKEANVEAYRVPALNLRIDWVESILEILQKETFFYKTQDLIRK
jgi:ferrochelatase